MQDFPAGQSGHDHFFDTFGKFGEATRDRGKMLANVADTVVEQNQFYLETLVTPASDAAKKLADAVGYDADLAALHRKLTAGGKLDKVVAEAVREADAADAQFRETARCDSDRPAPGCRLPVRWISQVSRGSSNERVFTQMAVGMRLAERDPRFVAVNLVQPEDGESALRNYRLQMRMLQYLRTQYPDARLTLHAGELTPGLVKPEDLTFHIREAVLVAGAERIGHGVDLVHEDDWQRLARTMARRGVAVEVPFSSNKQILGVAHDDHPFEAYRRHGVPVVLATDDPGVSRIDISHEYQYARATYGLSYPELKDLARASLTYAFLDGGSLWVRAAPTAPATTRCGCAPVPGRASRSPLRPVPATSRTTPRPPPSGGRRRRSPGSSAGTAAGADRERGAGPYGVRGTRTAPPPRAVKGLRPPAGRAARTSHGYARAMGERGEDETAGPPRVRAGRDNGRGAPDAEHAHRHPGGPAAGRTGRTAPPAEGDASATRPPRPSSPSAWRAPRSPPRSTASTVPNSGSPN